EAVVQTPRRFYEELVADIEECQAAYNELDQSNDALFGRDAPSLNDIRKALQESRTCLEPILNTKRLQEPDVETEARDESGPSTEDKSTGAGGDDRAGPSLTPTSPTVVRRTVRGAGGPITSVDDAKQRIL